MARKMKKVWNEGQSIANARRVAHFASGATLSQWRGRPATFTDRKAKSNKRACRGRIQEN